MKDLTRIVLDDLTGDKIVSLLQEHLNDMHLTSPPESIHALDLDELRQPNISFWSLWSGDHLAGCGALKQLDETHAEIKSMRTANAFRRTGVASRLVNHLIQEAIERGFQRVSIETGSMAFFEPARKLYSRHGFSPCPPFGDYELDPNSVFMTRSL